MEMEVKSEKGLETILYDNRLYCLILNDDYEKESTVFFTPDNFSQQLGYLPHKKGVVIRAHTHVYKKREVFYTQEVLFLKKGKLKINFYDNEQKYIGSRTAKKGDIILLCGGGHGFEILEDSVMVEVKQGPYLGDKDKVRFEGVENENNTGK